ARPRGAGGPAPALPATGRGPRSSMTNVLPRLTAPPNLLKLRTAIGARPGGASGVRVPVPAPRPIHSIILPQRRTSLDGFPTAGARSPIDPPAPGLGPAWDRPAPDPREPAPRPRP